MARSGEIIEVLFRQLMDRFFPYINVDEVSLNEDLVGGDNRPAKRKRKALYKPVDKELAKMDTEQVPGTQTDNGPDNGPDNEPDNEVDYGEETEVEDNNEDEKDLDDKELDDDAVIDKMLAMDAQHDVVDELAGLEESLATAKEALEASDAKNDSSNSINELVNKDESQEEDKNDDTSVKQNENNSEVNEWLYKKY